MKKMMLLLGIGVFWISCEDVNPSKVDTKFYQHASLTDDYPYIIEGENLVFNRYYRAEDKKQVADDEYAEDFIFEVPYTESNFSYEGTELEALKILYKSYCFCGPTDTLLILNGNISGEKSGNRWDIKVDLDYRRGYKWSEASDSIIFLQKANKSFSGSFSRSEISELD